MGGFVNAVVKKLKVSWFNFAIFHTELLLEAVINKAEDSKYARIFVLNLHDEFSLSYSLLCEGNCVYARPDWAKASMYLGQ